MAATKAPATSTSNDPDPTVRHIATMLGSDPDRWDILATLWDGWTGDLDSRRPRAVTLTGRAPRSVCRLDHRSQSVAARTRPGALQAALLNGWTMDGTGAECVSEFAAGETAIVEFQRRTNTLRVTPSTWKSIDPAVTWPIALVTIAGSLLGVVVGQYLARLNQREQLRHERVERTADRDHELRVREVELKEAHRSSLRSERLQTYRRYASAHLARKRADELHRIRFGHRKHVASQQPFPVEEFDAANKAWMEAAMNSTHARRNVEELSMTIGLVASKPVRTAVEDVQHAADRLAKEQLELQRGYDWARGAGPVDLDDLFKAQDVLAEAEAELLRVIGEELQLDR